MAQTQTLRRQVFETLDTDPSTAPNLYWITVGLVVLIALNVVAVIIETVQSIHDRYHVAFDIFEYVSLTVFSIEFALRVWSVPEDPSGRFAHPLWGRLRYLSSPWAIIDIVAILPSFLLLGSLVGGVDLRFLRVLRFFRLFRVLKLGRYSPAVNTLAEVFKEQWADLTVALGAAVILLVVSSSALYLVEHDAQPDKFASIPDAMWWAIITLTTIGYGDVYPITPMGKVFGGITALLGIGIVALPTAILGAGFIERLRRKKDEARATAARCPHCGEPLNAPSKADKQRVVVHTHE